MISQMYVPFTDLIKEQQYKEIARVIHEISDRSAQRNKIIKRCKTFLDVCYIYEDIRNVVNDRLRE